MFAQPVREIENLRAKSHRTEAAPLADGTPLDLPVASDLLDIRLEIEPGDAKVIKLDFPGRSITYDAARLKLNEAPLAPVDGRIRIQVLADRSLTEIIGNDGRVFITAVGKPAPGGGKVSVTAQGGTARLVSLEAHELKSIWQAR